MPEFSPPKRGLECSFRALWQDLHSQSSLGGSRHRSGEFYAGRVDKSAAGRERTKKSGSDQQGMERIPVEGGWDGVGLGGLGEGATLSDSPVFSFCVSPGGPGEKV